MSLFSEPAWNVDNDADHLNTSLFGFVSQLKKNKKHKVKKSKEAKKRKLSVVETISGVQENTYKKDATGNNDDMSRKKFKKKMKEKKRRKRKRNIQNMKSHVGEGTSDNTKVTGWDKDSDSPFKQKSVGSLKECKQNYGRNSELSVRDPKSKTTGKRKAERNLDLEVLTDDKKKKKMSEGDDSDLLPSPQEVVIVSDKMIKEGKHPNKRNKYKHLATEKSKVVKTEEKNYAADSSIQRNGNDADKDLAKCKSRNKSKRKSKEKCDGSVDLSSRNTRNPRNASSNPKKNLPFNLEKLNLVLQDKSVDTCSEQQRPEKKTALNKKIKDKTNKSLSLRERMLNRLSEARFRYLNEQLYTQTGQEACKLFQEDPTAFTVYHDGFESQVSKWPVNPLDIIIDEILKRSASLVVADFGCGSAKLSKSVQNCVHSFDLVALDDCVKVCDMAKVPLRTGSVDIAVFCLSLMGTNLTDYLQEANRVLKQGGLLMIAEVASRFQSVKHFLRQVKRLGFTIVNKDTSSKMFYTFEFTKTDETRKGSLPTIHLDPCIYKKR